MQTPCTDKPALLPWERFGRIGQNLRTFLLIRSRVPAGVCFHDRSTLTIHPKKKQTKNNNKTIRVNAMERPCIIFNLNLSTRELTRNPFSIRVTSSIIELVTDDRTSIPNIQAMNSRNINPNDW